MAADRKDVVPVIVLIVVAAAAAIAIFFWLDSTTGVHAAAEAPFDHSDCQYPNRLSNPPDGCDNSDPARPECMKFGTEECDLPYADGSTPTNPISVAPAPSGEVKTTPNIVNCTESK